MITEAQSGYSFCIITNGKRPAKLRREIESIRALNIPACEILVSGEVPPGFEDVRIVPALDAARNGRLGEMRNRLTEAAQYDHLVVCDDDLIFQQDFYRGLCDFGENYDVLCVRFLNPDGTRYWDWATSGGPRGHYLLDYDLTDPFVYVTGGLCVMKAYVASKVKWDDARGFYQAEDIDFSDRLKQAGFTIKLCTASSVIHDDNSYTQIDIAVVKRPDITKEIQVTPQVYGTGIYAAESALPPGVHWIAQECELRIPAAAFSCASAVSFDLAAANANYYESFPIEVEVTSDGQTIGKTVIPRSMQSIRAALQVAPRSNDLRIKIKSSSSFVPGHRGLWRDPRELALMLHNLHVAPLSVPETVKQAASCAPAPTASDPPLQQQHVDPPANAGPLSAHCIGIDARTLTYTESTVRGIGHYTFHLLRTLAAANRNDQYILFLDEPIHNEHIDELSALANVSIRYFSSEDPFPGLDLYLIPDPMSSPTGFDSPFVLAPRNIPLSVIFYDLIPLVLHEDHYDTWTSAVQAAYMRRLAQIKRTNALVFTISEHTKRDLQQHTGIAPGQIRTVMAGLNSSQGISPREREIAQTIQKYKISSPFFLFVGSHEPHKGFSVAVSAFLQARQQQPMELIVVGSAEDPFKALNQKFLNEHKIGGIKFTGHIPRRDLECLYAGAAALIFPSSYEGFGFPALEAMANSCPVITSNAASIPEVVGNAALAFEPKDTAAISGAMLQLVNNRELRSTMITRGLGRAQLFTWEKTAAAVNAAGKSSCSLPPSTRPAQQRQQRQHRHPRATSPLAPRHVSLGFPMH
ncbi:MAG TPA: glycosyltransferase [Oligoflexia bacterium]|nr:glycosyltransferase [Oligoflexia bacterium]